MTITQITTHTADALARLLERYKGKGKLQGLISSLTDQIQELEDALYTVMQGRSVYDATGAQLDALGGVVGLPRQPGWTDPVYQGLLLAQIGINVSQGETERVISVFKIVTQASHVKMQELFPAAISLFADAQVDPSLVNLLYHFCNSVVSAGVRVDAMGYYDPTNAFSFAGGSDGGGFGDLNDPSVGGKLAGLYQPTVPAFAFDGDDNNPDVAGFGDANDPAVGGQLQSL